MDGVSELESVGGLTTDGIFYGSANLSLGEHSITVQVTDSDDNSSQAQQTILLNLPIPNPTAKILSPTNHQAFGIQDSISLQGVAEDLESEFSELRVQWSSNLDGILDEFIPTSNEYFGSHRTEP